MEELFDKLEFYFYQIATVFTLLGFLYYTFFIRPKEAKKEARKAEKAREDAIVWRQAVQQAAQKYLLEYKKGSEEPCLSDDASGDYHGGRLSIDTTYDSEGHQKLMEIQIWGLNPDLIIVPRDTFKQDSIDYSAPNKHAETPTGDFELDSVIEVRGANDAMRNALRHSDLRQTMLELIPAGLRIERGINLKTKRFPAYPQELLDLLEQLTLLAKQIAKLQPKE